MNTEIRTPSGTALTGLMAPTIGRVLELARTHLQMDVAFLSEFTAGRQVFRAVDGQAESFGISPGDGPDLAATYCRKMVDGHIPHAVPDTRAEPLLRGLAATADRQIGSYIGVPLRLSDGSLYGTFCCLGHTAEPLGTRDVAFLSMLAELLVEELDARQRLALDHTAIAEILTAEAVETAFQPIMDLHNGRRLGVEALSRFPTHPGSPEAVFRTAHAVGLGPELETLTARRAAGFLPRLAAGQYLAVNLSPAAAFQLPAAAGSTVGVDLSRIVLEVTETDTVQNYEAFRGNLAPLRDQGLRLAIDDAGAGYASLHHIVELHPDIIKIDRSLIHGMALDRRRRSAVRAFVALAREMDAATVAEGIETQSDLEAARELGLSAAQGYLLGPPAPAP